MQCKCGASTKPGRAERSKQAAVLEFQGCPACGRCHFDALWIGGQVVATGAEAQRAFAALEAGQPYPPSKPPEHPITMQAPPMPPAGGNFSFAF